MELRNRILMCPMGDSLCETDGSISPNQAAYFEARARGGAALLLVGSVSIAYPEASFDERQVAASDDRYLPGLLDLTDRAHRHGARIAAQLVHNGQMSLLDVANGRPMLVPSVPKPPNPDRITMMVTPGEIAAMMSPFTQPTSKAEYRVATEGDIASVIERFVESAERCVRAGFDGIELHAGHGYLLDEFITPSLNTRSDGWGGSVENRARLLIEVIRAMRVRLGREFPLWIRINAIEHHKTDGETFEDQLKVIDMAVAAGVDAIHVTAYSSTDVATGPTDSYAPHVVGDLSDYAAVVRQRTALPVITFGRFEPHEAEQVLVDGKSDFVAMGRKLLADPDLPNKLAAGRVDDIRPCIYQYRCIGNIFVKESLHCIANASTGREHDFPESMALAPKHVLVVGGGPAGLETARVLSGAGHRVTLWEAGARLGGLLHLAGHADPLLDRYLGWLLGQVERAGVTVELGRTATVEAVHAFGADEVVVATGAVWDRPTVPGIESVRTIPDVGAWLAADDDSVGSRLVLLGGGKAALSIGSLALARGRSVTIVEPTNVFGVELGLPGRWRLVYDIERAGARLIPNATLMAVRPGSVQVTVEGVTEDLPADSVVLTSGAVPHDALGHALRAAGSAVHVVGNAASIGHLEGANIAAAELARALA